MPMRGPGASLLVLLALVAAGCAGSPSIGFSDACGLDGMSTPTTIPPEAQGHDVYARANEPFRVPLPPGEGPHVRYELHARGFGVSLAHPNGTPVSNLAGPVGILGGCGPIEADDVEHGVGPFVTDRDGSVAVQIWRLDATAREGAPS